MKQIIDWAQGNPGAMSFLMELGMNFPVQGLSIVPVIEQSTIRGTDLWVLYSDLCNKDIDQVEKLCKDCPRDILQDACSRQDYSGKKLVADYL